MGDAAIITIEGTKTNLAKVYPDKSATDLYKPIGVIPMIGSERRGRRNVHLLGRNKSRTVCKT